LDPDSSIQICIIAVLVLMSALFTAIEASLHAINKYRLRPMVAELNPKAILVNKILEEPSRGFDTIYIGRTFFNIAAIIMGTMLVIDYWGENYLAIVTLLVLSFVLIIFTKTLPKVIATKTPEKSSFALIRFLYAAMFVLYPIVWFISIFKLIFTKLIGEKENSHDDNNVTEEEIIELMAAGQEDGLILQEEKTMIHSVFDFTDTEAKDVMVPRPDIIAIEKGTTFTELLQIIKAEQFSRIPVYENSIDNILGVVHIKDLIIMAGSAELEKFSLNDYLRQIFFVPETKKVNELFKAMKKEKIHMAIVLDEYGSTAGLVTLEDLIEEIMGEIQDEHDTEEPQFNKIDANTVEVSGSIRIEELNEKLGLDLECEEAETVGGLVFAELDRVPAEGDRVQVKDVELIVQEMDGHRIEKLLLMRV